MITTNVKTLLPAQELATGMGTLNNAIYGDYGKGISFLKQYDVTTSSYINLISNYIYIRALIIGELEQSVNESIANSKFLMNKYMS